MIKKSKKIIASLLMTLTLVSIFPMTNVFAMTQEEKDFIETCDVAKYFTTQSGMKIPDLYEKDGKYYKVTETTDHINIIAKAMFISNHYAQEDGSLVANKWEYSRRSDYDKYTWRYFDEDYNCLKGYQTVNGVKYYFSEDDGDLKIGWFIQKGKVGEWHYSYPDGSVKEKEGWVNSNGNWYYINSDGIMAKDTTTPDGYRVNNKGVWKS